MDLSLPADLQPLLDHSKHAEPVVESAAPGGEGPKAEPPPAQAGNEGDKAASNGPTGAPEAVNGVQLGPQEAADAVAAAEALLGKALAAAKLNVQAVAKAHLAWQRARRAAGWVGGCVDVCVDVCVCLSEKWHAEVWGWRGEGDFVLTSR
jgi:hypothetical protein